MSNWKLRPAAIALAAALLAALFAGEAAGQAWVSSPSCCSPAPTVTTIAPAYTVQYAPAYTPVYTPVYTVPRVSLMPVVGAPTTVYSPVSLPVAQTCYYVPQTTYRWTYSRIERTSLRPVTTLDPCTGCPTTTYQPVTRRTLLPWLHREPVATYQMVCSPVCPTVTSSVVEPAGSILSSGCPSGCVPATSVPSLSTDPGYSSPSTFKTEPAAGSSAPATQGTLRPSADPNINPSSIQEPRLIDPESRSAARPLQYATYRHMTETAQVPAASGTSLDLSGWRASSE